MPPVRRQTRQRLLDAAYGLFYREGFARVGVDRIAAAAGVTKRTLYAHFDSKDALLAAVLEDQHPRVLAQIDGWAGEGKDLAGFLDALFQALCDWAQAPGWRGSGFTRVAFELADQPGHPARRAAQRHKALLEAWIAERLGTLGAADPGQSARQLQILIEGAMALTLIHGDHDYLATARAIARRTMAAEGSRKRKRRSVRRRAANPG